ncbi:hypothetical protein L6164_002678 [Bauhinia variegata]|uniref:Uncharacterized protein n=1 Tax=Bauhinia variegata TaxID=167791 RepID=A0ACB9Q0T0_BAUVA|nr:hypothetical protein L6164_002678 [Bauhinia variegata]
MAAQTLVYANSSHGVSALSKNSSINPVSPLYLHSFNSPGIMLVLTKFDGNGFNVWKKTTMIALSVKNNLEFIESEVLKLDLDSPLFTTWNRCNYMIISWTLNSLSKEIVDSVIYISIAQEMWIKLIEHFEQVNGVLIRSKNS